MTDPDLAELVLRRSRDKLGDPVTWKSPTGYPDSLALCIIDAIQSLGVRYVSVEHVLQRYRAARPGAADTDGPAELRSTFDERGSVDRWVQDIGNRNRTSTQPGAPLKAVAIGEAALFLEQATITSPAGLRTRLGPVGRDQSRLAPTAGSTFRDLVALLPDAGRCPGSEGGPDDLPLRAESEW